MEKLKLLVISHNPISTTNNMGKTMRTLFSAFTKEELCQLYIYPTIPDIDKCNSYYRITDKDVLKSYYKLKVHGREILSSEIKNTRSQLFERSEDEGLYRNVKNKKASRKLLRDLMWKCSCWYNKSLRKWLEKEKPTHIFIAPGGAKFLYDIALKISKKFNLPIVTYVCDEYYFVKQSKGLDALYQKQLGKKIEKLMAKTSHIVTICDQLKESYSKRFITPATTVMTGVNGLIEEEPQKIDKIERITYLGNIRLNRYLSIAQVGRALDEINAEKGTEYALDIYTGEKDPTILSNFDNIKSINLCGYVSGEDFDKVFKNSQSLMHVEAFDEDSKDRVKHSISTKIADSLSSGICLFAYGPSEVASIQYLLENNCAVVCTSQEELKEKLSFLFNGDKEREEIVTKALQIAAENHDINKVGEKVYEIISSI